jgi:hypothetical protein
MIIATNRSFYRRELMKPIQVRMLKIAAAIAVAGVMAGACAQQNPVSPTPVAGNVLLADQAALTASAAKNDEQVCHRRGNGTFALLSVNANAVDAHLRHGDGRPLGPVPGASQVFTSNCETVASVAGVWLGESITFDPNFGGCGRDRNEYRLTLTQSGSEVSGEVYWKILESFFPSDVGMEQTAPLTSGTVSGNTFTFSYGPPQLGLVATATFTDTTMSGTIVLAGSSACPTNTFTLVRQ